MWEKSVIVNVERGCKYSVHSRNNKNAQCALIKVGVKREFSKQKLELEIEYS